MEKVAASLNLLDRSGDRPLIVKLLPTDYQSITSLKDSCASLLTLRHLRAVLESFIIIDDAGIPNARVVTLVVNSGEIAKIRGQLQ